MTLPRGILAGRERVISGVGLQNGGDQSATQRQVAGRQDRPGSGEGKTGLDKPICGCESRPVPSNISRRS